MTARFALKTALAGLALLAVVLTAPGCGEVEKDDGALTIAFVGYSTTQPFWVALCGAAAEQAKKEGVTFVDMTSATPDAMMQTNAMDNAIDRKVDGIILGAVDSRAFGDSLDRAKAAGIPVVAVDTGIDHPWIGCLIQTDNLSAAGLAGDYIVKNMKPGKVLINGGTVGHQTADARRDGVKAAVEKAGGAVIFRDCEWKGEKTHETTLNELAANADITAIFNACDPMALAAISAVEEQGRAGKILIVGFDGNPANLKAIEAGEQDADIKQDNVRMGRESVTNLVRIIKGATVPKVVPIHGILITKENVAEFLAK
ncbi:sugar ABC transporter substrate-binding protein [bacterium]|nr:sugar ABC transporter substrate-binding protein [bacterium]